MSWSAFLETIPPETMLGFTITFVGIIFAALGGAGVLFRNWFLGRLEMERKTNEQAIETAKAKVDLDRLDIQNQLDQTQSSREMLRLQMSDNAENRKAFLSLLDTMRQDMNLRDAQHEKHLGEITASFRGIEGLAASTLELLKSSKETGEAMSIGQRKVLDQNEETHRKLTEITSDVAAIVIKLESLTVGRAGDRRVIEEIQTSLSQLLKVVTQLDSANLKIAVSTALEKTQPLEINEVTEQNKEFQGKHEGQ